MKRFFSVFILFLMLIPAISVSAEVKVLNCNLDQKEYKLTVSGENSEEKSRAMLVMILPEGPSGADSINTFDPAAKNAVALEPVMCGIDGKFSIVITLNPRIPSGTYRVFAGGDEVSAVTSASDTFEFVSLSDSENVMTAISGGTLDEIKAVLSDPAKLALISIDVTAAEGTGALIREANLTSSFADILFASKPSQTLDRNGIEEQLKKAAALSLIKAKSSTAEKLAALSKYSEILGTTAYSDGLLNADSKVQETAASAISNSDNLNGFLSTLKNDTFISIMNNGNWGNIKVALLEAYADLVTLDKTYYNMISDKDAVFMAMVGYTFTTPASIAAAFYSESRNVYDNENRTPGGSGGSGGSAPRGNNSSIGGGTISSIDNIMNQTPVVPDGYSAEFSDLEGYGWAIDAITSLKNKGIVTGSDGLNFEPHASITRAQLIKMLCVALDLKGNDDSDMSFSDVSENDWFYGYVKAAYDSGIVNGVTADSFNPNGEFTRQDLTLAIYRAQNLWKKSTETNSDITFADDGDIADYAKDAVYAMASYGIIRGRENNMFSPHDTASRAETAVIIHRILN